jgi:adenylate kinase
MKSLFLIIIGIVLIIGLPMCSFLTKRTQVTQEIKSPVKNTIFSFFGAPGSGKGTLADQCVKNLNFKVVSTGNLCRAEIASGSERGKLIKDQTEKGKLVPDELITQMVQEWLSKETKDGSPIILDGYPRTQRQAFIFLNLLKKDFPEYKLRIVNLAIPDEEIIKRLSDRLVCENKNCQAVYSKALLKGETKCQKCHANLIKREDDKEEVVKERLKIYAQHSNELINFYKSAGITIENLNVSGISIPEMFLRFKTLID